MSINVNEKFSNTNVTSTNFHVFLNVCAQRLVQSLPSSNFDYDHDYDPQGNTTEEGKRDVVSDSEVRW